VAYGPQIQVLAGDVAQFAASPQGQVALQLAQVADAAGKQLAPNDCSAGNTGNPDPNKLGPGEDEVQRLKDELARSGAKVSLDKIVRIARTTQGTIVWLEEGSDKSGLRHILSHAEDFANKGVAETEIPDLVMKAVTEGKVVGVAGKDREVYEVVFNGVRQFVAVSVGSNGYVVGANPVSWP
jgi:hypothetical protein